MIAIKEHTIISLEPKRLNGQMVTATRSKGRRSTLVASHGLTGVSWYGSDYHTAKFTINMPDGSDLKVTLSKEALRYLLRE